MPTLDDWAQYERSLQLELEKLDRYHPEDQPHVKQFVTKEDGRLEESSLGRYLASLRKTAQRIDEPLIHLTEMEADDHIFEIRNSNEYGRGDGPGVSDSTARNVQFTLRKFLQRVHEDDDDHWAHDYELIRIKDAEPVTGEDMLKSEDIQALVEAAHNMRDVAMIEFLADTGVRRTLAGSLRVGDLDLDADLPTFRPNPNATGLKGADIKDYPLVDSVATLRNYLRTTHPRPDEDDVALFHKIPGSGYTPSDDDDGAISPSNMRKQLRVIAKRAGVEKPVNPHNFRHSAVSRMRREGYSRSEVEHRVCWQVDSDMWEVYEHITADEHNDSIFHKAGMVDEDDVGEETTRAPCGNCHEPLAPYHQYCPRCGAAAAPETRELKSDATGSIGTAQVDVDNMSRREFRAFVLQKLDSDPSDLGHQESPSSSSD